LAATHIDPDVADAPQAVAHGWQSVCDRVNADNQMFCQELSKDRQQNANCITRTHDP
jgi:hypothetical protein